MGGADKGKCVSHRAWKRPSAGPLVVRLLFLDPLASLVLPQCGLLPSCAAVMGSCHTCISKPTSVPPESDPHWPKDRNIMICRED